MGQDEQNLLEAKSKRRYGKKDVTQGKLKTA